MLIYSLIFNKFCWKGNTLCYCSCVLASKCLMNYRETPASRFGKQEQVIANPLMAKNSRVGQKKKIFW